MRWNIASLFLVAAALVLTPGMPTEVAAQSKASNIIKTFDVQEQNDGTYVRIRGSSVPTFSVFKLTGPLRLFVDVFNSEIGGDAQSVKVNNGVISQVSLLEFKDSSRSVTRVIIGFDKAAHYDVKTDGNDVLIYVDGADRQKQQPVANLADELRKRDDTIAQTRKQLADLERQYEARLKANGSEINQTAKSLDETKQALANREKELASLKSQLRATKGSAKKQLAAKIDAKSAQVKSTRADVKAESKRLASLETELKSLNTARKADRKKLSKLQARAAKSQKERDSALALAKAKEAEGQKAAKRAKSLEMKLREAQGELKSSAQRVEASNAEMKRRQVELDKAKARQQSLEKEIAKLKRSSASNSEIAAMEQKRDNVGKTLAAREQELAAARADAKRAANERKSLNAKLASKDSEIAKLRAEINQNKKSAKRAEEERANALRVAVNREKKRLSSLEEVRKTNESNLDKERAMLVSLRNQRLNEEKKLRAIEGQLANNEQRADRRGRVAKAVPVDPTNAVRGIRLETDGGTSRIVVELDRPGQFQTLPGNSSRAVMILNDVELPNGLEKTLANGSQGGAVRFVSSYKDPQGRVRLEAELSHDAKEFVRQSGNKLVWEFAPSIQQAGNSRAVSQTRPNVGKGVTAQRYPRVVVDPTQVSTVPGMRRKRLTIDIRNTDIQNVLRLIAKEGGVNIVAGEGVSGEVTMRLKSVPLDEVFLTVLQSQNLGFEKRGNVIRVAPQKVLREEEGARAAARQAAVDSKPLEVFLMPINYATADDLTKQVEGLLSPRGSVSVDSRTNTLIIKDISENLGAIRALVTNLDSQVPQVLIEARIVETNDTFQQQLGIQWGGDLSFSQANGNPTGLVFPSNVGIAGGATDGQTPVAGTSPNPNFAVNLPAAAGTGSGGALGLALGSVGGALNINLRLSALEAAGHAKIVSSPKILTLDNTEASISQGTSIPISVVGAAGVQTVFVDATLELIVRPHVTPDGNVQMKIQATKNEPDFQNTGARGDPTIIRKEAETELLVKDGDTTVIGGIYTRNSGSAIAAVPFFHKIPVLGYFFRTETESDRRTELLIFITPKIVNRAESLGSVSTGAVNDGFKRESEGQ